MMLPPRLDPLLSRARKLAQHDETWECGVWVARHWIVESRQLPYRPYIFLLSADCGVPRIDLSHPPYTPAELQEQLLRAILKPAHGTLTARRPTRLRCADAAIVQQLAPVLARLGITREVHDASAAWRQHQRAFERTLNRGKEPLAGLASIPGASLAVQAHFYALAAVFYDLHPWRVLTDAYPLELRCPITSSPRYGVVMGSGGEIFGLAVYDTEAHARAIYDAVPPESSPALVLFYDVPTAMSFEDLDAIAEHGYPVAAPNAYPVLGRSSSDTILQPSLSDLVWMEGALAALVLYLSDHLLMAGRRVLPAELTLTVDATSGPITVGVRLPAFENPKLQWMR
jgi:hypothetical protein